MIRVAIADDHAMFVDGIESILQSETNIQLVDKCFDGNAVFQMLTGDRIDVLLLDINLPVMSGIEVTSKIQKEFPKVKVLALSMYNEKSFVTEILKNGALGYILKNTGRAELLKAIETVALGETYFSSEVTETIMSGLLKNNPIKKSSRLLIPKISRREKEVLALIVKEYTTQDIANSLFISLKTVESHRSNLISKLNVKNTAGLVRAAYELKLI
ncbi:MAG: response regulator transcription factor [Saprospiraceae bacterium]|jgi:DNA-binding NarL/FixJ family response regulator|nr:response regulator transcription factor [Candidatus Vicinibacter proximus]MBL7824148.1 response regulator transcription factor [Saprospiraceae bacterium]MCC6843853.1 response regulator transcription factor [Saprospiraceae bacterium]HRG31865.1 response regulator transcription factor [Saprospiraceae bacterium]